jgi:Galactose oxidase, central domain
MKARKTASFGFLILLMAMFSALGCGGGSSSGSQSNQEPPRPPGNAANVVVVSPAAVTLVPGGTQTFTVTVKGLVNTNVTWTVQEAAGGAVSDAGSYTAPIATGFYHVVATSVADATFNGSATITVTNSSARFTPTGSMQQARAFHTATLLPSGKVLMAGGGDHSDPICLVGIRSAEIYDPAAGVFTTTGSMASKRYAQSATLLLNGKILVAGGFGWVVDCEDLLTPVLSSAELYDPSSGTFTGTGSMVVARQGHTATLLQDGRVLVTGGKTQEGGSFSEATLKRAELYDPSIGRFTATGDMAIPRFAHTATLLANGIVLIAGGLDATDPNSPIATTTAELYNPATGVFTPAGSMTAAREGHSATLLASGRVLITGGSGLSTAELYDPATNSFSPTGSLVGARGLHTATRLTNGTVLVAGGVGVDNIEATSELYDPATGLFNTTGSMEVARRGHTATLLATGSVLVSGGAQGRSFLATAELYK